MKPKTFTDWFSTHQNKEVNITLLEKSYNDGFIQGRKYPELLDVLYKNIKKYTEGLNFAKNQSNYDFFMGMIFLFNEIAPQNLKIDNVPDKPEIWLDDYKRRKRIN